MNFLKKIFPLNKWGQGMRARWFAFIILIALFAWGSYSAYSVMFTHLGWQTEIPNPRIPIDTDIICPVPDCTETVPINELQTKNVSEETSAKNAADSSTDKRRTIIKAGESRCHVCGYQRNGSGIPWAAATSIIVLLIFFWISWRMTHGIKGSEVLIETEQELKKVVWPSKVRVLNSSFVVVLTMVIISAVLFVSDVLINLLIRNVLNLW